MLHTISFYIKGAASQNIQFEIRPYSGATAGSVNYQGGKAVTNSYTKISYDYAIPAGVTAMQLAFDLGGTQNTLYLDDVSITDASIVAPRIFDATKSSRPCLGKGVPEACAVRSRKESGSYLTGILCNNKLP